MPFPDRPPMRLAWAATGHQPHILGGESGASQTLRAIAVDFLANFEAVEVISGMAAGWDMAVAEAAVSLGVPLIAALAYASQGDTWPDDARRHLNAMLSRASLVQIMDERRLEGCWARRDRWVVDRGEAVLALWSGVKGGTGRAVAYAERANKPIVNLWPRWKEVAGLPGDM